MARRIESSGSSGPTAEAMPGWALTQARVEWRLQVRGRIRFWPDLEAEFPVTLLPTETRAATLTCELRKNDDSAPALAAGAAMAVVIAAENANFAPGETVTGHLRWRLPAAPASLELRLLWYVEGDDQDNREAKVVAVRPLPTGATGHARFTAVLPHAPYSCVGEYVRLRWALEMVAVRPDMACRRDFVMAPERQIISLSQAPNLTPAN